MATERLIPDCRYCVANHRPLLLDVMMIVGAFAAGVLASAKWTPAKPGLDIETHEPPKANLSRP